MSHFYGVLNNGGSRQSTRCSMGKRDYTATAASWQGSVQTTLVYDEDSGVDIAKVYLQPWQGSGVCQLLFHGPVSGQPMPKEYNKHIGEIPALTADSVRKLRDRIRELEARCEAYANELAQG